MPRFLAQLLGSSILRAPDDAAAGGSSAVDAGPLSVDDAAAFLMDSPDGLNADDEAPGAADAGADSVTGETGDDNILLVDPNAAVDELEPDDPAIEPEGDGGEPAQPAIAAPHSWDADAKAAFAKLPAELQKVISGREKARDDAVAKVQNDAAEARKRADTEASSFTALKADLDQLLPKAKERFAQMWPDTINWTDVADQYGAEQAFKIKAQYEQDQADLQRLETAQQNAAKVEFKSFVEAEFAKLPTLAPDLVHPEKGPERRRAVAEFMLGQGYSPEQVRGAGALEYGLIYDAMRYRQAVTALNARKAKGGAPGAPAAPAGAIPSKPASPALKRTSVAPAAAVAPRSSQQRAASEARARHAKAPTMVNAAAAILALGG